MEVSLELGAITTVKANFRQKGFGERVNLWKNYITKKMKVFGQL